MATTMLVWAILAWCAALLTAGASAFWQAMPSAAFLSGTAIPIIFTALVFGFGSSQGTIDHVFRVSDTD